MFLTRHRLLLLCICISSLWPVVQAAPLSLGFVTLADTNTPIPDGFGTFQSFETYSIDSSGVAFVANGQNTPSGSSQVGIYRFDTGGLNLIADRNTRVPFSLSTFSDLDDVSIYNGRVAIHTFDPGHSGIYSDRTGTLSRVANSFTSLPNGTGTFSTVEGRTPIYGNQIAFYGSNGAGEFGIYIDNGSGIQTVVDHTSTVPGTSIQFSYINGDSLAMRDADTITFAGRGTDGFWGVYRITNGVLAAVADTRGTLSGGRGGFSVVSAFFSGPAIDGDNIVFEGTRQSQIIRGLYLDDGSALLREIVNTGMDVPDGTGTFNDFRNPWIDNGSVVSWATGTDGEEGIYLFSNNDSSKIVAIGDALAGSTIVDLFTFGNEGLDMNSIVFRADLADGRQGLFRADFTVVPLPGAVWLLGSALGLLGWMRGKTA